MHTCPHEPEVYLPTSFFQLQHDSPAGQSWFFLQSFAIVVDVVVVGSGSGSGSGSGLILVVVVIAGGIFEAVVTTCEVGETDEIFKVVVMTCDIGEN